MRDKSIYLLPGRGETFDAPLGRALADAGYNISGREIVGDFARLPFAEQLSLIKSDLRSSFWDPEGNVVARSFGAYLLLNALAELEPFPGRILLLSPVLGLGVANDGRYVSRPPRAERFFGLVEAKKFPAPGYLEIHTGAEDSGCDPKLATRFAALVRNVELHVVPAVGHDLGEDYAVGVLHSFLSRMPRYD